MPDTFKLIEDLKLSFSQLCDVRDRMADSLKSGLSGRPGKLSPLPTYLPPPPENIKGEVLVVDIGGTNVRAARVCLSGPKQVSYPGGVVSSSLHPVWEKRSDFFSFQARLLDQLESGVALPLAYCFSYPAHPYPDRDSVLLHWTKGLVVPQVQGEKVGKLLREALLVQGLKVSEITVINDTVAALFGGYWAYGSRKEFSDFIGLVVGTGHNMAACFPRERVKLEGDSFPYQKMALNLESGNFYPPYLSRFDDELDSSRVDPGCQRLEKAVSGKFLPELYNFIFPQHPVRDASQMFILARTDPQTRAGAVAAAIINRSADLVGATLAGVIKEINPVGRVGVVAEGGVIVENRDYRLRVSRVLCSLLAEDLGRGDPEIMSLPEANLIGSALAAFTR